MFTVCMLVLCLGRMTSTLAVNLNSTYKTGALIFLHGLGDTPEGWSSLEQMLPKIKPRLSNVKYVFPAAPTIPISINGNAVMPGWFDILDWPIGLSARDDKDGMLKAVAQIEREVVKLEAEGIPRNRIVVGGFSQGGAIALLTAYKNTEKPSVAGCISLSGWLTLREEFSFSNSMLRPPLFWGHGKFDDKVLFEQQDHGVQILRNLGVEVLAKSYPIGHSSDPNEINELASFLDNLLYNENGEYSNE
jgi:lysophospholipase II